MAFLKLDCGILESSLWPDLPAFRMFMTVLPKATPFTLREPTPQLRIDSMASTGWTVPAGAYGFVAAASTALVHKSGLGAEEALAALHRLGEPEAESRSTAYDGRRLARIEGGFIVLNYIPYREKDHTHAQRQRDYRERQAKRAAKKRADRKVTRDVVDAIRSRSAEVPVGVDPVTGEDASKP